MMIEPDDSAQGPVNGAHSRALDRAAGRWVVTFADDVHQTARRDTLRSIAGVAGVMSTGEEGVAADPGQLDEGQAVDYARLGVAVVNASDAQAAALRSSRPVLAVRPSRVYRTLTEPGAGVLSYLLGRRDELADLYVKLGAQLNSAPAAVEELSFADTQQLTWGLQATRVATGSWTGRGVKIAVLDTGLDLTHPDFAGRRVESRSFVTRPGAPGEPQGPQDGHGHGTHCTGTACGPAAIPGGRRYGVAPDADIVVAKVLDDGGFGEDTTIIAGIEWALASGCQILSMSLGADVREIDVAYEAIGRRALDSGSLIVAAAGNNANRTFGDPGFVGVPANSPSIMAVGAVDRRLGIAAFSARSNPVDGGQVDLVGPGVAVYSSWPQGHRSIQGTSMAAPHVAGIAALWCEATGRRGRDLWSTVVQASRRLELPSTDVGAGLVQVPDR